MIHETAVATPSLQNKKRKTQATEVPPSFSSSSSSSSSANFSKIPFDIIPNILNKLPLKTLCRFKCVSKLWCSLILSNFDQSQRKPIFAELSKTRDGVTHNTRPIYSIDGNGIPKHICTSSVPDNIHGPFTSSHIDDLVYFLDFTQRNVLVCNMFTQEQILLRKTRKGFTARPYFELGFDPLSMKYKMLSMGNYPLGCQIYTLGTKRWRPVTRVPIHGCGRPSTQSFCFNGTMYWYSNTNMIISFNLADESFGVIPGLNRVTSGPGKVMYVFELEGCLCLADNRSISPRSLDLWMLKDYNINNNNATTWVLMATVFLPVLDTQWTSPYSTRTGEIVIAEDRSCGRFLYLYSFLTQQIDTIEVVGLASNFFVTNSVSLKTCEFDAPK